jgi:hypothetical protein
MNDDVARAILALGFDSTAHQRMQTLAGKARAGSLSPEEEIEIENYERAGSLLGILQSKARRALGSSDDCDF